MTPEEFILREEGKDGLQKDGTFRARWDAIGGCWSIGPGITTGVTRNTVWSAADVDEHFHTELVPFENAVDKSVKVPIGQNQRTALVSFAYNVGTGGFKGSSVLKYVNEKRFSDVPGRLALYIRGHAHHEIVPGLVNRRNAEIRLWKTPDVAYPGAETHPPMYNEHMPLTKFAKAIEEPTMADVPVTDTVGTALPNDTAGVNVSTSRAATTLATVSVSSIVAVLAPVLNYMDPNLVHWVVGACMALFGGLTIGLNIWSYLKFNAKTSENTLAQLNQFKDLAAKLASELDNVKAEQILKK